MQQQETPAPAAKPDKMPDGRPASLAPRPEQQPHPQAQLQQEQARLQRQQ